MRRRNFARAGRPCGRRVSRCTRRRGHPGRAPPPPSGTVAIAGSSAARRHRHRGRHVPVMGVVFLLAPGAWRGLDATGLLGDGCRVTGRRCCHAAAGPSSTTSTADQPGPAGRGGRQPRRTRSGQARPARPAAVVGHRSRAWWCRCGWTAGIRGRWRSTCRARARWRRSPQVRPPRQRPGMRRRPPPPSWSRSAPPTWSARASRPRAGSSPPSRSRMLADQRRAGPAPVRRGDRCSAVASRTPAPATSAMHWRSARRAARHGPPAGAAGARCRCVARGSASLPSLIAHRRPSATLVARWWPAVRAADGVARRARSDGLLRGRRTAGRHRRAGPARWPPGRVGASRGSAPEPGGTVSVTDWCAPGPA